MNDKTNHCCEDMVEAMDGADPLVLFVPKFREYGIPIRDGGSSYKVIGHCPWCGVTLPASLRDSWFDKLESLGVDPIDEQAVPKEFTDDRWYT